MAENEKKPGAVGELKSGAVAEPGAPSVATRDEENDSDRENHRYRIAFLLILGLLIIVVIPVINKNYDNAADLAAIFSGWITSVVGFYFLQQNTEKAQQQTTIAAKDAAEARKEVAGAAKKQVNLASHASTTSFKWKEMFEEAYQSRAFYEGLYEETEKSKNIYKGLYEEAQTLINEMLQELDGDAGGDD